MECEGHECEIHVTFMNAYLSTIQFTQARTCYVTLQMLSYLFKNL